MWWNELQCNGKLKSQILTTQTVNSYQKRANVTQFDGIACTSNNGSKMHGPFSFSYCINEWCITNGVTESFVHVWVIPIPITSCAFRSDAMILKRSNWHPSPCTIITFGTTDTYSTPEFEYLRWSLVMSPALDQEPASYPRLQKGKPNQNFYNDRFSGLLRPNFASRLFSEISLRVWFLSIFLHINRANQGYSTICGLSENQIILDFSFLVSRPSANPSWKVLFLGRF